MSIIRKMRKQNAVWWARSATADQYGRFSYAEPVQIDCRWDDTSVEFRDTQGEKQLSDATVYPDRVLALGDKLKLGPVDSNTTDDPTEDRDAYEIRRFDQIPNLKATETLFIAYL